jgi:hypothetical protein
MGGLESEWMTSEFRAASNVTLSVGSLPNRAEFGDGV